MRNWQNFGSGFTTGFFVETVECVVATVFTEAETVVSSIMLNPDPDSSSLTLSSSSSMSCT